MVPRLAAESNHQPFVVGGASEPQQVAAVEKPVGGVLDLGKMSLTPACFPVAVGHQINVSRLATATPSRRSGRDRPRGGDMDGPAGPAEGQEGRSEVPTSFHCLSGPWRLSAAVPSAPSTASRCPIWRGMGLARPDRSRLPIDLQELVSEQTGFPTRCPKWHWRRSSRTGRGGLSPRRRAGEAPPAHGCYR